MLCSFFWIILYAKPEGNIIFILFSLEEELLSLEINNFPSKLIWAFNPFEIISNLLKDNIAWLSLILLPYLSDKKKYI